MKNWDDIKTELEGADLLLGNGFSIAIHEGFKYDNLYSQFETGCSIKAQNLFTDFGTKKL